MQTTYEDEDAFLRAVSELPSVAALGQVERAGILDGLILANAEAASSADDVHSGHELRLGRWFIRNDDLPFFELVATVASGVALLSTGGVAAAALTAKISALAAGVWKVWRKGARLSEDQVVVIGLLDPQQARSVDAIVADVTALGRTLDGATVEALLESLTRLELYDGTEVAVVKHDDHGWRALRT